MNMDVKRQQSQRTSRPLLAGAFLWPLTLLVSLVALPQADAQKTGAQKSNAEQAKDSAVSALAPSASVPSASDLTNPYDNRLAADAPTQKALPQSAPVNQKAPRLIQPAKAKRLTLPAHRPSVTQANYWRRVDQRSSQEDRQKQATNQPNALAQPAWLTPTIGEFPPFTPMEPIGQSVVIGDALIENLSTPHSAASPIPATIHSEEPSTQVALATALVRTTPSRASLLLATASDMAVKARTVGDMSDVVEQCRRAMNEQPTPATANGLVRLIAWACNRRGELREEAGDEHLAFEDYQQAIQYAPDCWEALHNRGVTLARYSRNEDALEDFDQVVTLAPDFVLARRNRAEVLCQLGRLQQAIADYSAAIQTMPNDASLYAARGYAWGQLGKTTKAASDFRRALQLDATLAEAYEGRGNLFAEKGYFEQAAEDFKQALKLNPQSGTTYQSVAWLLSTCPMAEYRSEAKGLIAAKKAQQLLGGNSPVLLDMLAAAHANAGEFHKAITYEQQAIVLATDDKKATYQNRLALYRNGQPYRASQP